MTQRRFTQVDVFTDRVLQGNGLAVVHDAQGLSDEQMQSFARWLNLSETSFLLPPSDPSADYHVRIFTPGRELPFAGHPTLGTAWAWLNAGGMPKSSTHIVQACGVGLVRVRRPDVEGVLAFAAPPLKVEALAAGELPIVCEALGIQPKEVQRAAWLTNGPRFLVLKLATAQQVLDLNPNHEALKRSRMSVGVVGMHAANSQTLLEVRAFLIAADGVEEDPVTGSMQASVAGWLMASGDVPQRYVAAQGAKVGRAGRIYLERGDDGVLWVGGAVVACIEGLVAL